MTRDDLAVGPEFSDFLARLTSRGLRAAGADVVIRSILGGDESSETVRGGFEPDATQKGYQS
jgi:hypothetical protein